MTDGSLDGNPNGAGAENLLAVGFGPELSQRQSGGEEEPGNEGVEQQLQPPPRQRAALARAVIMSPEVILADEPTGNVDWEMSLRLLRLLIELNRMGKTVMIATHDMNLIRQAKAQVQARVLRISDRRLQLAGADL